jgi:hypothetical protein
VTKAERHTILFLSLAVYRVEDVHIGAPNAVAFATEDAQGLTRYLDAQTIGRLHSHNVASDLVRDSIPQRFDLQAFQNQSLAPWSNPLRQKA